jgi:hypothetical protein
MSVYVIDANILIQAHRSTYPLDVVSSYWLKLKQLADSGRIISIDKVKQEVCQHEDPLKNWCDANLPSTFFKDTKTVMSAYAQVVGWASTLSHHYLPNALAEFLDADEADAFIVAYALANISNVVIVTHEISEPKRKNKVKIPDACIALSVRYINIMDMFRELKETF